MKIHKNDRESEKRKQMKKKVSSDFGELKMKAIF